MIALILIVVTLGILIGVALSQHYRITELTTRVEGLEHALQELAASEPSVTIASSTKTLLLD